MICIRAGEGWARKVYALQGLLGVERQLSLTRGTRWPAGSSAGCMVVRKAPLERDGARPREARILERGEACSRGSSRGPPWWAVEVPAAGAVPCMVRQSVFGFVAGFKWGFPGC
jgi:hypothetical protein